MAKQKEIILTFTENEEQCSPGLSLKWLMVEGGTLSSLTHKSPRLC